jgi:hypothetical protein
MPIVLAHSQLLPSLFTMLVSNTLTIGDLFTMLVFPYKGDLFTTYARFFEHSNCGGLFFEHMVVS